MFNITLVRFRNLRIAWRVGKIGPPGGRSMSTLAFMFVTTDLGKGVYVPFDNF